MAHDVPTTVDELQARANALQAVGNWQALRAMATEVIEAATGRGEEVSELVSWAWAYRAGSSRRLDDVGATIEGWRRAIAVAPDPEAAHVSPFHGNLAYALLDVDEIDDALYHLDEAVRLEPTAEGQRNLAGKRAEILVRVGELRTAEAIYKRILDDYARDGVSGGEVGRTLDSLAALYANLGELEEAAELHEHAAAMFDVDDLDARLRNAVSRVSIAEALNRAMDERYIELLEVAAAWAWARIDPAHYDRGFRRSVPRRTEEGFAAWTEGAVAQDEGRVQDALTIWSRGAEEAAAAGDSHFALRLRANLAALLSDLGDFQKAVALCWEVADTASREGIALAESMARRQLATLAAVGVPTGRTPLVGLLALARALDELQVAQAREHGVKGEALAFWQCDPSRVVDNEVGVDALERGASAVAATYLASAVAQAREIGAWPQYTTRTANLLLAARLQDPPDEQAAEEAAARLREVLDGQDVSGVYRARALEGLGTHLAQRGNHEAAFATLSEGVEIVEQLRQQLPPGPGRAAFQAEHRLLFYHLATVLRRSGRIAEAFDVMARVKGRRVLDVLSADGDRPDSSVATTDVRRWMQDGLLPGSTVVVDLAVEAHGLAALLVWADGATAVEVDGPRMLPSLLSLELGESSARAERIVRACREHPLVLTLVAEVESRIAEEVGSDASVLLVPDGVLANLPLHAVEVEGEPWYTRRRISWTPSIGAMPFFADATSSPSAVVFGDSGAYPREILPGAAAECRTVAAMLDTEPLVGPDRCSRETLAEALGDGDHDVVHLAVHGRADPQAGARSGLLVGPGDWMTFDELVALPWRARLVVFSGCSTAASSPRYTGDLLDVATAAAEAGAATVIASLWPIDDEAARVFMEAFHGWWTPRRATRADLREGMAVARDELRRWLAGRTSTSRDERSWRRDGRTLSLGPPGPRPAGTPGLDDPALDWAPFVLLGDPYAGMGSDPT